MNAAALRLQDIAANDCEVSGFGNEVLIMAGEQSRHQDVAEAVNSVGVEGMGVVSTMQSMPMVCWQTWRMINLADGGWIRIIPMDVGCSRYLVDACGPWVQATEAAGLQAVLAEDLAQHLQWTISRIEWTKAQMSLQAREAAVEVMGLAGPDGVESWAVEATVAMSAPPRSRRGRRATSS
ncbi:MAG: hypothetical protein E6Q67_03160 [Roseateles sp.]|nr:MAG: hypothetical protein E6Q67_03160 [Roseateles sp.]